MAWGARAARQSGFTLFELMIVVAVIGILAAIALPSYQDYTRRSRLAEALVLGQEAQRAVAEYYDRWGRLPVNNLAAGLATPAAYRGHNVAAIGVDNGMVIIDLEPGPFRGTGSNVATRLYLRPAVLRERPTAALVWLCGTNAKPPGGFNVVGTLGADSVDQRILPVPCR